MSGSEFIARGKNSADISIYVPLGILYNLKMKVVRTFMLLVGRY